MSPEVAEGVPYDDRSAAGVAQIFRYFGRIEAPQLDSPLYAELCEGVAEDPELLAIAVQTPVSQPPPNMLFAAAQYLLLGGAEHPLAAHYPAISGAPRRDAPAFPAFRDFCLDHRDEIESLVTTRMTQTNVLKRCVCLLPAFATLGLEAPDRPLALIEVGPSAGLNMHWDRYQYDYADVRGAHVTWGDPASPVRLDAELRGDLPLPDLTAAPRVAWRAGVDLNPIDLTDPDGVRWLRALIWPEHVERHARLATAIELARERPPRIVTGDAVEELPALLDEAPRDAQLCVYATHALYQFSRDARVALYAAMQRASRLRPVAFLSMEGTRPPHSELMLTRYRGDERTTRKLADCNPHGWWVEWIADDRPRGYGSGLA